MLKLINLFKLKLWYEFISLGMYYMSTNKTLVVAKAFPIMENTTK